MITQELLDFLRKEKANGHTREEIKAFLVQKGWPASDVEEGFRHLETGAGVVTTMPKKTHKGRVALFFLLLLLFAGGASAYYFREEIKSLPVVRELFPSKGPCIMVITEARNPDTGEIQVFGNPCEVPKGWEVREPNMETTTTTTNTATDLNATPASVKFIAKGFVNRTEIKGANLFAQTVYGKSPVAADGNFEIGVTGDFNFFDIALVDDQQRLRGSGVFFPLSPPAVIDLSSTVVSAFFGSPSKEDSKLTYQEVFEKARGFACFSKASTFLKNKLLDPTYDLNNIVKEYDYSKLSQDCWTEFISKSRGL